MFEALKGIKEEIESLESFNLESLDKSKTAFVVVDMVRGFYNVGPLASDRVEKTIEPILKLNEKLKDCKKVFFIDSHTEDSVEFKSYPAHCLKGTVEEELIEELKDKVDSNTSVIRKNSINGFHAPDFKLWLEKNSEIENFIVTGVCSNICVETFVITLKTYFDEKNMDKEIIVPINATETYELGNHNAELMNLLTFYKLKSNGINVVKKIL